MTKGENSYKNDQLYNKLNAIVKYGCIFKDFF
jgi:hypothetical protein